MTLSLLGLTAVLAALYLYWTTRGDKRSTATPTASSKTTPIEDGVLLTRLAQRRWNGHRATWMHFGFVFALGFLNLAFEYTTDVRPEGKRHVPELRPEVEIKVVPTIQPEDTPPPPPPPPAPVETFSLNDIIETVDEPVLIEEPVLEQPVAVAPDVVAVVAPPPPPAPERMEEPKVDIQEVFRVVEQMPRFGGCDANLTEDALASCSNRAILEYIGDKTRYPSLAVDNRVQGTAVVSFVIERDGSITDLELLRDPGAGTGAEALRVVRSMPRWEPGRQRGEPVRVRFNLPVKFRLTN